MYATTNGFEILQQQQSRSSSFSPGVSFTAEPTSHCSEALHSAENAYDGMYVCMCIAVIHSFQFLNQVS